MIYSKLQNINQYKNLHPNLDIAIDWISNQNVLNLSLGNYEIKDKDVYAFVAELDSYDDETKQYEVHQHYADIHVVLDDEMFYYDDQTEMGDPKTDYVEQDDYRLYKLKSEHNLIKPRKLDFLIFLPGDGHVPKYTGKKNKIKKLVIKVKIK